MLLSPRRSYWKQSPDYTATWVGAVHGVLQKNATSAGRRLGGGAGGCGPGQVGGRPMGGPSRCHQERPGQQEGSVQLIISGT